MRIYYKIIKSEHNILLFACEKKYLNKVININGTKYHVRKNIFYENECSISEFKDILKNSN